MSGTRGLATKIPEVRTESPSPTEALHATLPAPAGSSQDELVPIGSSATALTTDTESEGGYLSTQSITQQEFEPGRLSVFSRRTASKVPSEHERRTMTIETETVANIGHNSVLKADHHARSLRGKASTDTVRPSQKPKKKRSRVAVTSLNHVPTKSEIFAATITQAVDEMEDSDSDETFVYESNPRSPKRHSRRSSFGSTQSSSGERHASHSRLEAGPKYSQGLHTYDNRDKTTRAHAISGKRSMKFANNPYHEESQRRHVSHTLGQHRSTLDDHNNISPRVRPGLERRLTSPISSAQNSPRLSRPASPRVSQRYGATGSKRERAGKPTSFRPWSLYEDEEEGGSSSEMSPFLRKRSSRLHRSSREQTHAGGLMTGMPFIIIIICLMLMTCLIAAGILSTSQPLRDIKVVNITSVLVSKQELLFDLVVEAYNPNALAITVSEVEISVFAQSPYVRDGDHPKAPPALGRRQASSSKPKRNAIGGFWPPWHPSHNQSGDGDYPTEEEDSTTLLLGRVYKFDSSLQFESRFFNRSVSTASGELRVPKPGNITDEDGVETWERVIQHSFELIIRGVMRYRTSSFSKTVRTAELYKTAHINPARVELDTNIDGGGARVRSRKLPRDDLDL